MQAFLDGAATTMTAVADLLVAGHGIAFRTAHDVVGQLVARHADAASLPPAALKEALEAQPLQLGAHRPGCRPAAMERGMYAGPGRQGLAEPRAVEGELEARLAEQRWRGSGPSPRRTLCRCSLIVESSSGTLALGLAQVATLKGYRLIVVTDPRIDDMLKRNLRVLGTELEIVEECHPTGGWQLSRLIRLHEILAKNPEAFWTRQYDTPSNAGAYEAMADELIDALGTDIVALVGSVGSGGSLTGTARFLREKIPQVRVVAVDAVGSVLFHQPPRSRLQSGHGNNIVPGNVDYRQIDEVHWLSDGEAFNACRELARREAIFAGGSSGATYVAACWVAQQYGPDQHVVAVMPDSGHRYHDLVYSDEALAEKGLVDEMAAAQPRALRYGVDVAERWSYSAVPHDGSVPYFASDVRRTSELIEELGRQGSA